MRLRVLGLPGRADVPLSDLHLANLRLSTVVRASQIVVLQRGRLIERGRHDELAGAGGLYQRLHDFDVLPGARTPSRSA